MGATARISGILNAVHSGDSIHYAIYVSRFCGACYRVLRTVNELQLDVEVRDVTLHPSLRNEIREATGRRTVPVMRMTYEDGREEWMFESRDIAAYLRQRFGDAALATTP